MNYFQLLREVELANQQEKIDLLKADLNAARQEGVFIHESLDSLNAENEALKKVMQNYVEQIDALNRRNALLSGAPNAEKDPRVAELLQQIEKLGAQLEEEKRRGALAPLELNVMEEEYKQLVVKLGELLKEIEGEEKRK